MNRTAALLAAPLLVLMAPAALSAADFGLTPAKASDEGTITSPRPADSPPGFEPITGPVSTQDEIAPERLVIAAYLLIWALLLLYLLLLWRRLERVGREMESLATRLERHGSSG